jgi:hypothetical protein
VVAVAARAVPARPLRARDDEDDDRPRRRDDDDEDDRPRRRPARDEDDDEDDRPRRKRKKSGMPVWVFAAGGGAVLFVIAVAAVGGYLLLGRGAGGSTGLFRKPPAGWTDVRDTEIGFQVFLPGQVTKGQRMVNGKPSPGANLYGGHDGKITTMLFATTAPGNFNPGSSPDELYALFKNPNYGGAGIEAPWNEVESRTPVTLGGKPGLMVKVKEKKNWMDRQNMPGVPADFFKGLPEEQRKQMEDAQKKSREMMDEANKKFADMDAARPGRREVYFLAVNGQKVVLIHLSTTGEYPDDGALKSISDSFEFR